MSFQTLTYVAAMGLIRRVKAKREKQRKSRGRKHNVKDAKHKHKHKIIDKAYCCWPPQYRGSVW